VVDLWEWMMILGLSRQGLTVAAIARETGHDRKTVRKYIARGLKPRAYQPVDEIAGAALLVAERGGCGWRWGGRARRRVS